MGEFVDFSLVRDSGPPAVGLGEEIERLLVVVTHSLALAERFPRRYEMNEGTLR